MPSARRSSGSAPSGLRRCPGWRACVRVPVELGTGGVRGSQTLPKRGCSRGSRHTRFATVRPMIVPIPSGTRDVLPDEMRELRAIVEAVRATFDTAGYGEIATPALEYESVLGRGVLDGVPARLPRLRRERRGAGAARSDPTVPITQRGSSAPATPARSCRCASPTTRTAIAAFAHSAASRASSCRPGSS